MVKIPFQMVTKKNIHGNYKSVLNYNYHVCTKENLHMQLIFTIC